MLKIRIKPLYLGITAAVIIACIVALIVFIPSTSEVEYEIVKKGINLKGTIIRNEQVRDLSEYEKLDFSGLIDGEKVEKDQAVVNAYKKGYVKSTLEKLAQTEASIVTYQNQTILRNYDDKKIEKYDFTISVLIRRMAENSSGYIELYTELCDVLNERRKYISDTYLSEPNTYLEGLYKDEANLQQSIDAWRDVITAEESGYIGFFCDGREEVLLTDSVNGLTEKLLDEKREAKKNAYKIVTDEKWYIAVPYDDNVSLLQMGMYYAVFIDNETVSETGCLENIIPDGGDNILLFSFTDNVEKYIGKRDVTVLVGDRYEGYSLEPEFVKDGIVIVKDGEEKKQVAVNVVYSDSEKTVFDVTDEIKIGQKVYEK